MQSCKPGLSVGVEQIPTPWSNITAATEQTVVIRRYHKRALFLRTVLEPPLRGQNCAQFCAHPGYKSTGLSSWSKVAKSVTLPLSTHCGDGKGTPHMDRVTKLAEAFFESPFLWGVITLVAIGLALRGKLSVNAATIVLWCALGTAVFGVYRAEVIYKLDTVLRYLILGTLAGAFAIPTVLLTRWIKPEDKPISPYTQPTMPPGQTQTVPKPTPIQLAVTPERPRPHRPPESESQKPQQQPVIIQTAPTFGNLKERAITLSQEIMEDLWINGWHSNPVAHVQKPPGFIVFQQMPKSYEEQKQWVHSRSNYFHWKFFDRVLDMRNEYAQLHIRDQRLDDFLKHEGVIEDANTHMVVIPPPEVNFILPQDIEDVTERLRALADQLK